MLADVLSAFGLRKPECTLKPFGNGLINNTWLISYREQHFILQRINTHVFTKPQQIADNIARIGSYLATTVPDYYFIHPLKTNQGQTMLHHPTEGYFRLVPFVENSHTVDVVNNVAQAYEAAKQFGKFTRMLRGFDAGSLQITLPQFHDLELRFVQFRQSQHTASPERTKAAGDLIDFLKSKESIVAEYRSITGNAAFKIRVTHHDTKISNVLFDETGRGICVIDLDTVMPGYFISDVGDMMRTYLSPVSEEEKDTAKIEVRDDYFAAIVKGYLSEMQAELSETEKRHFVYAGKFMIYMQALRFVADYLNNDRYYGQKYEGQNLVRATNQVVLLQKLLDKEALLQSQVAALNTLSVSP